MGRRSALRFRPEVLRRLKLRPVCGLRPRLRASVEVFGTAARGCSVPVERVVLGLSPFGARGLRVCFRIALGRHPPTCNG
jgi:hypothetical protein